MRRPRQSPDSISHLTTSTLYLPSHWLTFSALSSSVAPWTTGAKEKHAIAKQKKKINYTSGSPAFYNSVIDASVFGSPPWPMCIQLDAPEPGYRSVPGQTRPWLRKRAACPCFGWICRCGRCERGCIWLTHNTWSTEATEEKVPQKKCHRRKTATFLPPFFVSYSFPTLYALTSWLFSAWAGSAESQEECSKPMSPGPAGTKITDQGRTNSHNQNHRPEHSQPANRKINKRESRKQKNWRSTSKTTSQSGRALLHRFFFSRTMPKNAIPKPGEQTDYDNEAVSRGGFFSVVVQRPL